MAAPKQSARGNFPGALLPKLLRNIIIVKVSKKLANTKIFDNLAYNIH